MKKYHIEISRQKEIFMTNHKKYIQIFKQYGYVLNFKFRDMSKNEKQYTYVIVELYPANCSKDKENSKNIIIFVSKILSLSIKKNKYKIYNSNLQSSLEKFIKKLDKSNKVSLNIAQKFKLYLFYPTIFKKYYKDIFSPVIFICFVVFILVMAIMEAKATAHWKYEIFGIGSK